MKRSFAETAINEARLMRWLVLITATAAAGCLGEPTPEPTPTTVTPDPVAARVMAALNRLDEDPDKLHGDYTPAVVELIRLGEPAIGPTLPYLLSDSEETRQHAQRVIEGVTMGMSGFVPGQGWTKPEGEKEWRKLHTGIWDNPADFNQLCKAPLHARLAYIDRIENWRAGRQH